jgi:hypothetical protein
MEVGVWYICYEGLRKRTLRDDARKVGRPEEQAVSMPDKYQRPPLRYRRFGGGYRREDVEFSLAELRLTLRQLDKDLESLRDRNRELESELATARHEIELSRAKERELSQTMSMAFRRAAEIEEGASNRAREIIAQAEEAAMRIRSEASRRIEDSSTQFHELLHLRNSLLDAMRGVIGDFNHAITRVERGEQVFPGVMQAVPGEAAPHAAAAPPPAAEPWLAAEPAAAPAPEAAPAPPFVPPPIERAPPVSPPVPEPPAFVAPPAPEPSPADTASIPAAPPPPAPPPVASPPVQPEREEQLFDTRVELDVGPFSDFAALSAFERSLAHLPKVEDVYVRRLADDRALIELTLSEPGQLLQAMRQSLPYALEVRSANRSKLVVNVSVQTPAGTPR